MRALHTPGFVRPRSLVTFLFTALVILALAPAATRAAAPTASIIADEDGTMVTVTGRHFAPFTPIHLGFTSFDHATMQASGMAMDVTSDAAGSFAVQVTWQLVPLYGCFRNEMVTIGGSSTPDDVVAPTAVCQPPIVPAA